MSRLTITRRLIALVTVPLLFTGGFAAWALATTGREAASASRLMNLIAVAKQAGVLADKLQQERAAATAVLLRGLRVLRVLRVLGSPGSVRSFDGFDSGRRKDGALGSGVFETNPRAVR